MTNDQIRKAVESATTPEQLRTIVLDSTNPIYTAASIVLYLTGQRPERVKRFGQLIKGDSPEDQNGNTLAAFFTGTLATLEETR